MTTRFVLICILGLLPAVTARAQSAQDMFTEGHELVDRWMSMRHVVDLDGQPPLDVIGWWWPQGHALNPTFARVRLWTSNGLGGLDVVWQFDTPSASGFPLKRNASTLGDFNGNGKQDFAIAIGDLLFVYLLQGAQAPAYYGQISDPWDYALFNKPLGLVATDCDGDGLDELITATPRMLRLFRNPGLGQPFQLADSELLIDALPSTLVDNHVEMALGELDGDPTRLELAVLGHHVGGGLDLRIYDLDGASFSLLWTLQLDAPHGSHLAIGDIDGSGRDDIVVFGTDGMFQVMRQTGPGVFAPGPRTPGGPSTTLADVNNNGYLDGICCSTGGGGGGATSPPNTLSSVFRVALNDGTGNFAPAVEFPGLGSQRIAGAVDMDGDGDLDLLAGRMILFNHLEVGTSYCEATPNSTGEPASMQAGGTASLARADLELIAEHVPSHQFGLFYYGVSSVQVPFGDGYRCVGGQTYRLPVLLTGASGTATHVLDYGDLASGGAIDAGSTWRFQFWFRDPAGAGGGFNLSDGLRVTFGP